MRQPMVDRRSGSRGTRDERGPVDAEPEPPAPDEDEVRRELEGAAVDLERVTSLLHERTEALDTLEALVDHLLGLVDVPLVVVDADGRIAAVSRTAADTVDDLADALGKQATAVLPAGALTAGAAVSGAEDGGLRVVALPRGSSLVRLDR
jgi:hypothetical protein